MLTENDFKNILTALDPDESIDYEYILLILAKHYYLKALEMNVSHWSAAEKRYQDKADKIIDYIGVFKKMH